MEYTKVTCTLSSDHELARELLISELGNAGFESFTETEEAVEAYIPSGNFSPELLQSENLQHSEFFSFRRSRGNRYLCLILSLFTRRQIAPPAA